MTWALLRMAVSIQLQLQPQQQQLLLILLLLLLQTFDDLDTATDGCITGLIHCTDAVQQLVVSLQRQMHSNTVHSTRRMRDEILKAA